MHSTIFMLGPTDKIIKNNNLQTMQADNGKYRVLISNCTPFTTLLTQDKTIAKHSETILLGHHKKMKMPKGSSVNLFNLVSDADSSMMSLKQIESICQRNSFKRVFNHPKNIQLTSRAKARSVFANIPGLIVPKTVETSFSSASDLAGKITQSGLQYPVIVRATGMHGGEGMYLLNSETEINDLPDEIQLPETPLLLIEYLLHTKKQTFFHKIRIVFVDGKIYPRHCIFSDNWCVHASARESIMLSDKGLRDREKEFLENFEANLTDSQRQVLETMQQRLKLDLWGLDCAINDDGNIVLFEANACMNFHDQQFGPNNEFHYIKPFQQQVRRAIKKMILRN